MPQKKVVPATPRGRVSGFNQQKMIDLFSKGKSIAQVADAVGASPVWTRRIIATKAPEVYRQHVQARGTQTVQARSTAAEARGSGQRGEAGDINGSVVDAIARAVASAMFSDAQLVPQPVTRTEMFNNISKGVREGIKKVNIGFHS